MELKALHWRMGSSGIIKEIVIVTKESRSLIVYNQKVVLAAVLKL